MAIYHLSCSIVQSSKGQSAVQKAAYCSGERLQAVKTGRSYDYSKRKDVVFSEILLCKNAPGFFADRTTLWNSVELFEQSLPSRENARLARHFDIALPKELNRSAQIFLSRKYLQENFISKGMIVDWSLHDKGDGNPHLHCMVTLRELTPSGEWKRHKSRSQYLCRNPVTGDELYLFPDILKDYPAYEKVYRFKNSLDEKIKMTKTEASAYPDLILCSKTAVKNKVPINDWDDVETLKAWRKAWANLANQVLIENGFLAAATLDERTLEAQSIIRIPQIHVGVSGQDMTNKGLYSERFIQNEGIKTDNVRLKALDQTLALLELEKKKLLDTAILTPISPNTNRNEENNEPKFTDSRTQAALSDADRFKYLLRERQHRADGRKSDFNALTQRFAGTAREIERTLKKDRER